MDVAKRHREQRTLNRCSTCKNRAVREALVLALKDIRKHPERYGGLTQPALHEWCGARAAGIRFEAWRKCIEFHHNALSVMAAAR